MEHARTRRRPAMADTVAAVSALLLLLLPLLHPVGGLVAPTMTWSQLQPRQDARRAAAEPVLHDAEHTWDENGYVLGCMCGGRFGNQFDLMLGFLSYAKAINRTAVLGPWIEYHGGEAQHFPEFADFFDIAPLRAFHRVIGMGQFLRQFGSEWERAGVWGFSTRGEDGAWGHPFWRHVLRQLPSHGDLDGELPTFTKFVSLTVDHSNSAAVGRVHPSGTDPRGALVIEHPVLALDCTPGRGRRAPNNHLYSAYPEARALDALAGHVEWGGVVAQRTRAFVAEHFGEDAFVAVHFRNEFSLLSKMVTVEDPDGDEGGTRQVCESFSVPQCTEANGGSAQLPVGACMPSKEEAEAALVAQLRGVGARHIFVASDAPMELMLPAVRDALLAVSESHGVKLVTRPNDRFGVDGLYRPQIDLAILSMAASAIAHCPSSFSNVATRIRLARHAGGKVLPTAYWGLPSTFMPPPELRNAHAAGTSTRSRRARMMERGQHDETPETWAPTRARVVDEPPRHERTAATTQVTVSAEARAARAARGRARALARELRARGLHASDGEL